MLNPAFKQFSKSAEHISTDCIDVEGLEVFVVKVKHPSIVGHVNALVGRALKPNCEFTFDYRLLDVQDFRRYERCRCCLGVNVEEARMSFIWHKRNGEGALREVVQYRDSWDCDPWVRAVFQTAQDVFDVLSVKVNPPKPYMQEEPYSEFAERANLNVT